MLTNRRASGTIDTAEYPGHQRSSVNQEQPVPDLAPRDRVQELESLMANMPQAKTLTLHHFAHGTYTRELRIPAGTLLTGKVHRESCINILAAGTIRIATAEGGVDLSAPHVFVSNPGVKKAGYALTDVVWVNVHPWNGEDDMKQIENKVVEPEFTALEQENRPCLG